MKKIYRFEDAAGIGMYGFPFALNNLQRSRHPAPESDEPLMASLEREWCHVFSSRNRFGFASLEQLHAWVPYKKWLRGLHADGLFLTEYLCKDADVFLGESQAIFKNHKSKTQYNILKYFKERLDKTQKKSILKSPKQN